MPFCQMLHSEFGISVKMVCSNKATEGGDLFSPLLGCSVIKRQIRISQIINKATPSRGDIIIQSIIIIGHVILWDNANRLELHILDHQMIGKCLKSNSHVVVGHLDT